MARKPKKRTSKISSHKQTISAQTRVKLSQSAKKRPRLKGRFTKTKFAAEGPIQGPRSKDKARWKGGGRAGEARPPKGSVRGGDPAQMSKSRQSGMTDAEFKGVLKTQVNELMEKGLSRNDAESYARQIVRARTGKLAAVTDFERPGMRTSSSDLRGVEKTLRSANWKEGEGLYRTRFAETRRRSDALNPSEIMKELAPQHKKEVEKLLKDPYSNFNLGLEPGRPHTGRAKYAKQRHRLERYSLNLQSGMSHQEAYQQLAKETRGRKSTTVAKKQAKRGTGTRTDTMAGRKGKFQKQVTKETGKGFGIDIPKVDSVEALSQHFPDLSQQELIRLQQTQREGYYDQFLKNNKWAHETKRANITGERGDVSASNRVTFFTTSLGAPNASVPADSLVGQYIIRKRKNFLKKEGWNSRDLAGTFPNAVRDMHIIEAGTGRSLGAEGRVGVYKQGGWRAGSRKSKGFGKAIPSGTQVLTDSQGRPVYDEAGNVIFSEGATRPFKVGTRRQLGARVFLG